MLQQFEENKLWLTTFVVASAGFWLLVAFLKTPPTTTTSNAPPPGVSKSSFSRNTTFRLQGIPTQLHGEPISEEQVKNLLKTAWNINSSVIITIRSLATDPLDNSKKIATLVFESLPQFLASPAQRWTTMLPGDADGPIELTLDVDFFGLTPFHRLPDADCRYDIVALSGLNGHAFGSFKQRGESSFMWVRDALPQYLTQAKVHARVFIYGYDSQLNKSDSFQEVSDLGLAFKNKMVQLTQSSATSGTNRLILIGHSLGGILVKQAIISLAKNTDLIDEKRTLARLVGSMFFGTPSQGIDIKTLLPMVNGQPNELLVRTLGPSSGMLRNQMDYFRHTFERMSFSVVWYYETKESPTARQVWRFRSLMPLQLVCEWTMDGPKRKLVEISSATNGMPHDYGRHTVHPVNRSHSEMVKFQGSTDEVYRQVLANLKNIISSPMSGSSAYPSRGGDLLLEANSKLAMIPSLTSEQQVFLESLDFNGQDSRRDSIARATENTCDWFFRSHEFRNWIDPDSAIGDKGLLWVKGNPGVGKSTLMREALRRTQDYVLRASTSIVSFFFNARGEELEKTTKGLYQSLLHQILKHDPNALAYLLPNYLERKRGKRDDGVEWAEELLKDYVSRVCRFGISMPVLVFIDALDECTGPEISRLVEFFQGLVDQTKGANANLRVCISSRHCPRPPTFGYPEITVEHHNKGDIHTYIGTELKNYKSLLELRDQIFKRSSGVFLWVRLAIKQLREEEDMYSGRSIDFLKKRLTEIPPELGELFGSLLEKIPSAAQPRSICVFQLVLSSQERLSAGIIASIISFNSETRFQTIEDLAASGERINGLENQKAMITSLSGGLLEFEGHESHCQFIHESVRDYFVRYGGFKSLSIPQDNLNVVGWCHSGLVTSTVNRLRVISTEIAKFTRERASETFKDSSSKKMLEREDYDEDLWSQAIDHVHENLQLDDDYSIEYITTHIEIAEREGFSQETSLRILNQVFTDMFCIVDQNDYFTDRLLYDCCIGGMGCFNTVSRLIEMEEDPRSMVNKCGESHGTYPLSLACKNENSGPLVELLLRKGAEVNARDRENKTALMEAAYHTSSLDVLQLLISHGADVQIRDHNGETALHMAAKSRQIGRLDVVNLLLSHEADVQIRDEKGETALHKAVLRWDTETSNVIQVLLSHGADVQSQDHKGETALHKSIHHSRITKLLLSRGADPHIEDKHGQTPLIMASSRGLFRSFLPLIDAGTNVNHQTPSGKTIVCTSTSFMLKAFQGKDKENRQDVFRAIQRLIQAGLDLNARDIDDNTVYDVWKTLEEYVRNDDAEYRLWKEVERSLRPED